MCLVMKGLKPDGETDPQKSSQASRGKEMRRTCRMVVVVVVDVRDRRGGGSEDRWTPQAMGWDIDLTETDYQFLASRGREEKAAQGEEGEREVFERERTSVNGFPIRYPPA